MTKPRRRSGGSAAMTKPSPAQQQDESAGLRERIAWLEEIIAERFGILPPAIEENTVTRHEAAFELGIPINSRDVRISQMVKNGQLKTIAFGKRDRVTKKSLDEEKRRRSLGLRFRGDT